MTTRRQRRIIAANRALVRFERRLERDVARAFRDLSRVIEERFSHGASAVLDEWIDEFEQHLAALLARHMARIATHFGGTFFDHARSLGLLDEEGFSNDRGGVQRTITRGTYETPETAADSFNQSLYFGYKGFADIFNAAIQIWVATQSFLKARLIAGTVRQEARRALSEGITAGDGERQLAKRIATAVSGPRTKSHWAMIARTEAHTAAEQGSFEAAKSTGLDMVKEWGATEDMRTRFTHAVADGQIRQMDVPFDVGADKLMFPGDPNGSAKEVINCRCVALYHPVLDGEIIR